MSKSTVSARSADAALLFSLVALLTMIGLSARSRFFDPDEFQHLQMAWLIAIGEVPYRDFFEHHTPLYHLIVALFLKNSTAVTNGQIAINIVTRLRLLGVGLCVLLVIMTDYIARTLTDKLTGRCAALILASSMIFATKGLEIRPDQLAACLMLGATLSLMWADTAYRPQLPFVICGATTVLSTLTTQKMVLAIPGLVFTFIIVVIQRRMTSYQIVIAVLSVICGIFLAATPIILWLIHNNALTIFTIDNFLLGARWVRDTYPLKANLSAILGQETLFVLLCGFGIISVVVQGSHTTRWLLAVIAPMVSMIVMMPLFPVVQQQYFFVWLPYAAILGGVGAVFVIDQIGHTPTLRASAALLIVCSIFAHGALTIKDQRSYDVVTFAKLRYTVEHSSPDAKVLRSWSTGMVFRRPAFFYFSLNPEIRAIVPQREWQTLEQGLRDGSIAPELIEMDQDMLSVPKGVLRLLHYGWVPTGIGNIWRRKGRQLDLALVPRLP